MKVRARFGFLGVENTGEFAELLCAAWQHQDFSSGAILEYWVLGF